MCVCIPAMCWDRTSVKSGLKVPPNNTSHPSVAIRPAITGALPPTVHLFPGMSRDASTSSLNSVSFSIKRLQSKQTWEALKLNYKQNHFLNEPRLCFAAVLVPCINNSARPGLNQMTGFTHRCLSVQLKQRTFLILL